MSSCRQFPLWTLGLLISTLVLSGCAVIEFFDGLNQKPYANGPALRADEDSRVSAIRESRAEPRPRLFFKKVPHFWQYFIND